VLAESDDQEEIIARVAALDIGKAELVCCVRFPAPRGRRKRLQEVSTHPTMTSSLTELANHLVELGVQRVVMEATSEYWKPVFYLLEAHGLEPWLVNARDVKHLPGRPKTDVIDAVWLCKLAERQMLRPSFVPPLPIRRLRDLTRYRVDLVAARTAEKNRVEKLLEDACIKLSVVASDIFGVSGRAMMAALIAGERDPTVLAQPARRRLRTKITRLEDAFNGHFDEHHRFLLARMLGRIDSIDADIAAVDEQIEAHLAPFAAAAARLDEIPGIGPVAAAAIIAEVGLDMSRFRTAGHLCSWAKFSPGINSSAGKTKGNRSSGHGNRYLARTLGGGRRRRRQNQHLPGRTLSAHRQAARQETRDGRGRPLHPGHHLASTQQRRRQIHRSRARPLHQTPQPRPAQAQPHPPTRSPRLHRHPHPGRLTTTATSPLFSD
jgi:transposase